MSLAEKEACPLLERKKRVLVVFRDPGDCHAVIPILRRLEQIYFPVELYCHGGSERYQKSDLMVAYPEIKEVKHAYNAESFGDLSNVALVATSICSEGGSGKDLATAALKLNIPVVAVQHHLDISEQNETGWGGELLPSLLVLPHSYSIGPTLAAWPSMPPKNILVSWTALDRFRTRANTARRLATQKLRKQLKIKDEPVPLVAVMGTNKRLVDLVLGATAAIQNSNAVLLIEAHPRMTSEAPDELAMAKDVAKGLGERVRWIRNEDAPNADELIRAVDVLASAGSPILIEAARVGTPSIAFGDARPPASSALGVVPYAQNTVEYASLIQEALSGELGARLLPTWQRYLTTSGDEAKRVADYIKNCFLND